MSPDNRNLKDVLLRVRARLEASEESDWAALRPPEVMAILDREVQSLEEHGRLVDATELSSLFAPTAEIQEISMANRWSEDYMKLANEFDEAVKRYA